MEERKHYSEAFKKTVVKEVLSGQLSKEEAKHRYGIKGNSAILNWIRNFDSFQDNGMTKKQPISDQKIAQLQAENKRLHEEIELERLKVLALNVMIDLAEEQLKVPIRKKSGAKQ
jgi:transposase